MAGILTQLMTQLVISAAVGLFIDHLGDKPRKPKPLSICVALVVLTSLLAQ